jgi:hypothetical protein
VGEYFYLEITGDETFGEKRKKKKNPQCSRMTLPSWVFTMLNR